MLGFHKYTCNAGAVVVKSLVESRTWDYIFPKNVQPCFKQVFELLSFTEAAGLPHPNFDNEDREDEHETTDPDSGVDWRLRHKNDW